VSQINLNWTASTSGAGIANYVVQRCQGVGCTNFGQIATPTATSFSDTGLVINTSYSYQVQAIDSGGTPSAFSSVATASTFSSTTNLISYVQGTFATPQSSQSTVNVAFTGAQAAGDLNVVVVGWNDATSSISTVTDKSGNVYTRAVGPTLMSPYLSQSIYYAPNIKAAAAGANVVTITFSSAASSPDVRILEYNGADLTTPVDVTAASSGNSATDSTTSVTTTHASDLLFAANMVATSTPGAGNGFTLRLLTTPDADIAEDRMVTTTGSYSGSSAALTPGGPWVIQMIAFRAAGN
jgi:fibronectin type 3 domain-containing protein